MTGWSEVERKRQYLAFAHLPPMLQALSRPCRELVDALILVVKEFPDPDWDEFAEGVRLLVQAKDAFVRAAVRGQQTKRD